MNHELCKTCPQDQRESCTHRGDPFCDGRLCDAAEAYASQDEVYRRELLVASRDTDYTFLDLGGLGETLGTTDFEELAQYLDLSILTDKQRECIHRRFWEGQTEREIAEEMDLDRRTIQTHIDRAFTKLLGEIRQPYIRKYRGKKPKLDQIIHLRCPNCKAIYVFERDWDRILVFPEDQKEATPAGEERTMEDSP